MSYKIVVDSTFGLPEQYILENDIRVVPLNVIIDDKSYKDSVDISLEEVMDSLNKGSKVSTSQPSPLAFNQVFNQLKNEGITDIICMTISSTLSGTFNSASLGAEGVDGVNIYVVDTLLAAMGAEMLCREMVNELNSGKSVKDAIKKIEELKKTSIIILSMENLNALKKSGRITRIKAAIGNLMRVKPLLEYVDGILTVSSKFRTDTAIINNIIEKLKKEISKVNNKIHVYVSHVQAEERILKFKEKIEEVFKNIKIHLSRQITPVIAINIGYGGVGISWCYD